MFRVFEQFNKFEVFAVPRVMGGNYVVVPANCETGEGLQPVTIDGERLSVAYC